MYPCATKNWLWWVQIYLRERIMANHISFIVKKYKIKNNQKVLIFLQSFHWGHVKFLLDNPSKKEIWNYYFGKFSEVTYQRFPRKLAKIIRCFINIGSSTRIFKVYGYKRFGKIGRGLSL